MKNGGLEGYWIGAAIFCLSPVAVMGQWVETRGLRPESISAVAKKGNYLFASTNFHHIGIVRSADCGASWVPADSGLPDTHSITAIGATESILVAGTNGNGVYVSTDNGGHWIKINSGLPANCRVMHFAADDSTVLASAEDHVYLSIDNGKNWQPVDSKLPAHARGAAVAVSGGNLFVGSSGGGIFHSNDNGTNWSIADSVPSGLGFISALTVKKDMIIAGGGGIFISTNDGKSWKASDSGIPDHTYGIYSLAANETSIFACIGGCGLYLSTDDGASWNRIDTGFPLIDARSIAVNGSTILTVGATEFPLFRSTDNGKNWSLDSIFTSRGISVQSMTINGTALIIGTKDYGAYYSTNMGKCWTVPKSGLAVTSYYVMATIPSLATIGNKILACKIADNYGFHKDYMGEIMVSSDSGVNWMNYGSGIKGIVRAFVTIDSVIFAGATPNYYHWGQTLGGGVFRSTDNGSHWSRLYPELPDTLIYALATSGNYLFAGAESGVYLSTNSGASWSKVNTGLTDTTIRSLATNGKYVLAGPERGGIFLTENNGAKWTASNSGLPGKVSINALFASNNTFFAGTNGNGVYLLKNDGATWEAVNTGLPDTMVVNCFSVTGGHLFAGTQRGVWRRPLSEMVPVLAQQGHPRQQAFPNLRISHTASRNTITLSFTLPHPQKAVLTVYNLSGHAVAMLSNNHVAAGAHCVPWEIRNIPSGFYSVLLRTESGSVARSISVVH